MQPWLAVYLVVSYNESMVIELFLTLLSSLNFAKSASFLDSTEADRLTTDTVVTNVNSLSNGGLTEISDVGSGDVL